MAKAISLVGQKFRMLTVIEDGNTRRWTRGNGKPAISAYSVCRCNCGKVLEVRNSLLLTGHQQSCGCYKENIRAAARTHGLSNTTTYSSWRSMLDRCLNIKSKHFKKYGAVGIRVCPQWKESFEHFLSDMGERPKGTSIERKDVFGNYEPSNCCWATASRQQRNRKDTKWFNINGLRGALPDLAEWFGINKHTVNGRLKRGWTPNRAFSAPKRKNQYA